METIVFFWFSCWALPQATFGATTFREFVTIAREGICGGSERRWACSIPRSTPPTAPKLGRTSEPRASESPAWGKRGFLMRIGL